MEIQKFTAFKHKFNKIIDRVNISDYDYSLDKEKYDLDGLDKFENELFDSNIIIPKVIESSLDELNKELNNLLTNSDYYFKNNREDVIKKIDNIYDSIKTENNRIKYLELLGDKNLILIGANGAGKSALSAFMKNSLSDRFVVIPAQKFLFYDKSNKELPILNRQLFLEMQKSNYNEKKVFDDVFNQGYRNRCSNLSQIFNALISLTVNEYIEALHEKEIESNSGKREIIVENSNYKTFCDLWKMLIPEISWELNTTTRSIIPCKNQKSYNINDMSDGEKVIIFYLLSVLNAEENSYIIVDEPETYLNPSNYKRIWNLLEEKRQDCTFIYISHNVDFISTRFDHEMYWCKSYDGNTEWEIQKIDVEAKQLPKSLITELLGTQVPIIFCEGKDNSLDYRVYSLLFENKAIVIPVEGHKRVVSYTNAYNSIPNNSNKAYGIIDRDQYSSDKLQNYKCKGIYSLFFNEIEMLLLTEEILDEIIENVSNKSDAVKAEFQSKFLDIFDKRKKRQ